MTRPGNGCDTDSKGIRGKLEDLGKLEDAQAERMLVVHGDGGSGAGRTGCVICGL